MSALRSAANGLPGVSDGALSNDDAVVRAVARAVVQGLVVLVEPAVSVPPMPVRRTTTAARSSPPPGTARQVLAAEPAPPPPAPPAPPALPALEKVSVEGAEVLPEVLQALDQITAALSEVEEMSASLAPAPDGIPAISEEMSSAVDDVKTKLGEV